MGNLMLEDPQLFLDKTLKALCVLECFATKAVELVVYRLVAFVEQWFETLQMGRSIALHPLTWEEFSEAFMARFLPASRKANLPANFEKLR